METLRERTITGLRMRYFPKSRIGHGLIMVTPWINIILLIMFFMFIDRKLVVQPGATVELPLGTQVLGTRAELKLVIRAVAGGAKEAAKELIYFNDERFPVGDPARMKDLQEKLAQLAQSRQTTGIAVFADKAVNLETLAAVFNMAREIGVPESEHRVQVGS